MLKLCKVRTMLKQCKVVTMLKQCKVVTMLKLCKIVLCWDSVKLYSVETMQNCTLLKQCTIVLCWNSVKLHSVETGKIVFCWNRQNCTLLKQCKIVLCWNREMKNECSMWSKLFLCIEKSVHINGNHGTYSLNYCIKGFVSINFKQHRRSNQEWTLEIHGQHWAQDTERRQTK
jgi:hypothetical protein